MRDRGIDTNALDYILDVEKRNGEDFVFVDGWTAKGVITKELKRYIAQYNDDYNREVSDKLVVLSDIGGTADITASYEDYAIPSGILNSTVSGLVSRSIWNEQIAEDDFHGAMYYKEFEEHDKTLTFIDAIMKTMNGIDKKPPCFNPELAKVQQKELMGYVANLMEEHDETDINMIKPGIAEATRVMLRRIPKALYIKDKSVSDIAHLIQLAKDKEIPIFVDNKMPINAAAIISNAKDG